MLWLTPRLRDDEGEKGMPRLRDDEEEKGTSRLRDDEEEFFYCHPRDKRSL